MSRYGRARPGELTLEEFLKNAETGVLDDRVESFMARGMYDLPTAKAWLAGRRNGTAKAIRSIKKACRPTLCQRNATAAWRSFG